MSEREALKALVSKIRECEVGLVSMATVAAIHGFKYGGPSWKDELEAAEAILALTPPTKSVESGTE